MITGATVLLISRDLQARARVERAVTEVGATLTAATQAQLETIGSTRFDVVLLDLDEAEGSVGPGERLAKESGGRIGYYSHVSPELADKAATEGWRTIPRGRFWRELPELLKEALS